MVEALALSHVTNNHKHVAGPTLEVQFLAHCELWVIKKKKHKLVKQSHIHTRIKLTISHENNQLT